MIHNLLVTVEGHTFPAICTTMRNRDYVREVSSVAAPNVSMHVMGTLDEASIDVHDILEVIRHYLNDTATRVTAANCGTILFSWSVQDHDALRADLTGRSYHVKLTSKCGQRFECETGASNSWHALDIAKVVFNRLVWSSVVTPLDPQ